MDTKKDTGSDSQIHGGYCREFMNKKDNKGQFYCDAHH